MNSDLAKIGLEGLVLAIIARAVSSTGSTIAGTVDLASRQADGSIGVAEKLLEARALEEITIAANTVERTENVETIAVINQDRVVTASIDVGPARLRKLDRNGGSVTLAVQRHIHVQGSRDSVGSGQTSERSVTEGGQRAANITELKDDGAAVGIEGGSRENKAQRKSQVDDDARVARSAELSATLNRSNASSATSVGGSGLARARLEEDNLVGARGAKVTNVATGAVGGGELGSEGTTTNGQASDRVVESTLDIATAVNAKEANVADITVNRDAENTSSTRRSHGGRLDVDVTQQLIGDGLGDARGIASSRGRGDDRGLERGVGTSKGRARSVVMKIGIRDEDTSGNIVTVLALRDQLVLAVVTSTPDLLVLSHDQNVTTTTLDAHGTISTASSRGVDLANRSAVRRAMLVLVDGTLSAQQVSADVSGFGIDDLADNVLAISDLLECALNTIANQTRLEDRAIVGHNG